MYAEMMYMCEADDMVVLRKAEDPDNTILAAVDKDVLNAVAGKHLNYYESQKYGIKMKWVEIDETHAKLWPYKQCIMGDAGDNVIGCHGIGPKRVCKYIYPGLTDKELWENVVRAYGSVDKDPIDALINMNLVNMRLLYRDGNKIKVKRWYPPKSG